MYCKNCGTKIDDSGKFCSGCGTEYKKSDRMIIKKEENIIVKKKNRLLIIIILIVISIILISIVPIEKTISKQVPYQEAIYKTVYRTEIVTKYRTVYYGTLKDSSSSLFGLKDTSQIWTFDNAVSWKKEYTRQAGSAEYKFTITGIDGTESYYYDIDWWNINQKQVPYTETVSIPEQVIDRYETKYKTEYANVRKPLISWILGFDK